MKMKNKIQLKKAIIFSLLIIVFFNIVFGIYSFYQYRVYNTNLNKNIASIVTKIGEKYPNVDRNEIVDILNDSDKKDSDVLKEYGIDLYKDSAILENDKYFNIFLIFNLLLITVSSTAVLLIFLRYSRAQNKKIYEIAKYIEQINNKDYTLDIDDNTEDELSILKSEVYKTTVMLKEMAENSTKDKMSLKDSLAEISHQLKTPLTSIIIMLDNILDNPQMDMDTRNDFVKDMKRSVVNINFLVNSLLALSRLEVNAVTFYRKEINIDDILNESIHNLAALCDLKNIRINVYNNTKIIINCDFKWQVEAITNILKNCIEHSNTNSEINIYCDKNKLYSKIKIQDFGIGIDNKDLPHIFEKFYKGKNSSSNSVGIGLYLAKTIIEKDNGYIQAESEVNKGTAFTIKYFNNV